MPVNPKTRRKPRLRARALATSTLVGLVAACSSVPPAQIPAPLRAPRTDTVADEILQDARGAQRRRPLVEQQGDILPPRSAIDAQPAEAPVPDMPHRRAVSLVLDAVPLPTFINVVFGMELDFAIQIDQSISARTDLVSLRLTEPRTPAQAYTIAREVLLSYGVQVSELGGVLRFTPVQESASGALPRLTVTRSLPDVPPGQRPAFVSMPLEAAQPGAVAAQLRGLFGNHQVTFTELVEANALMISGPGDAVRAAMEAVATLDASMLRGKRSLRINPLYLNADLLARELREVLTAQGVSIRAGAGSGGALTFVPVNSANALIAFADSQDVLNLVAEWAERLDQPNEDGAGGGMFLYSARHTTVETLVPVLEALVGGAGTSAQGGSRGASATPPADGQTAQVGQSRAPTGSQVTAISGAGGQLAVDPVRNVIVFQGDAQRWRGIQGILARLDQPAR